MRIPLWALHLLFWLTQAGVNIVLVVLGSAGADPSGDYAAKLAQIAVFKLFRAALGALLILPAGPFVRRVAAGRRDGWSVGAAVFMACFCALAWDASTALIFSLPALNGVPVDWPRLIHTALGPIGVMLVWAIGYFALLQFRELELRHRAAVEAQALASTAQLARLRAQLNPHFLFNALASVQGLVQEDPRRASAMISEVGDFLRQALRASELATVPLREELATASRYLAIESMRLDGALRVETTIDPSLTEAPIPPLLLQPLLENAVAHGRPAPDGTVSVTLRVARDGDDIVCRVQSPGTLGPMREAGVGLANVRQQLQAWCPDRSSLALHTGDDIVTAEVRWRAA